MIDVQAFPALQAELSRERPCCAALARNGNVAGLAHKLTKGEPLTDAERRFLAAMLSGEPKKRGQKPARGLAGRQDASYAAFWFYHHHEGLVETWAIDLAAKDVGASPATVRNHVIALRDDTDFLVIDRRMKAEEAALQRFSEKSLNKKVLPKAEI